MIELNQGTSQNSDIGRHRRAADVYLISRSEECSRIGSGQPWRRLRV